MRILSIGTGREWREFNAYHSDSFVVHVDYLYNNNHHIVFSENDNCELIGEDIFKYLENYPERDFDSIEACRVFEHIPADKISYLLYLLYSVSKPKATLRIVVPDFLKVGEELNKLEELLACNSIQLAPRVFNRKMIELTSEFFNEKSDPHQSVWTPNLANYYLSLEGYWVPGGFTHIHLDGRNWYLDMCASRAPVVQTKNMVIDDRKRRKG